MSWLFDHPDRLRRLAGWLVLVSVAEWAAATATGWVSSVEYVSHLSQLAITLAFLMWWQGVRVEARQVEDDIPGAVVDEMIERTTAEPVRPSPMRGDQ